MPKTCVIIPCYNEAKRLPFDAFREFCQANTDISFCFVNDGSADNTAELLNDFHKELPTQVLVVDLKKNGGKAEAVRQGMLTVTDNKYSFDFVGYFDADLATPLSEIHHFLGYYSRHPDCVFLLGSRVKKIGAAIQRNGLRHILGRLLATLFGVMLRLGVYDSQCGAKMIKTAVAKEIFQTVFISKWLFDIELILRTKQLIKNNKINGYIYEKPVYFWSEIKDSKIKWFDVFPVLYDVYKIRKQYIK